MVENRCEMSIVSALPRQIPTAPFIKAELAR